MERSVDRPTFGSALRVVEFRALFSAQLLSLLGDRAAAVALAVLVYDRSDSAFLTACVFAMLFLPHSFAAPLATVADRYDRRSVMVVCDLARLGLVLLMALPGVPLAALLALLGAVVLFEAPFDAARGAVTPEILGKDLYPVGMSLSTAVYQSSQVLGALTGGALLLVVSPQLCLLLNAGTFLVSAGVLLRWMAPHPVPPLPGGAPGAQRQAGLLSGVVSDVASAARLVGRNPRLRRWMLLAYLIAAVGVLPEGLAASYVAQTDQGPLLLGLLLAAGPAGCTFGALMVGKWSEERRAAWMLPLAAISLAALLPTAVVRDPAVLLPLWVLAGVGASALMIAATFLTLEVPASHRGRVDGLMSSGLMGVQGIGLLLGGALADLLPAAVVLTLGAQLGLAALVGLAFVMQRNPAPRLLAAQQPAEASTTTPLALAA